MTMAISLGIILLVIALIFCCLFPLLRSFCIRATVKSMSVVACPCHKEGLHPDEEEDVLLMAVEISETKATGLDPLPKDKEVDY